MEPELSVLLPRFNAATAQGADEFLSTLLSRADEIEQAIFEGGEWGNAHPAAVASGVSDRGERDQTLVIATVVSDPCHDRLEGSQRSNHGVNVGGRAGEQSGSTLCASSHLGVEPRSRHAEKEPRIRSTQVNPPPCSSQQGSAGGVEIRDADSACEVVTSSTGDDSHGGARRAGSAEEAVHRGVEGAVSPHHR